jgi:2,3-bisphosphoglycerate-independent phosphoglycerate mutase
VVHISKSINDGTFFKNPAFVDAIRHVKKYNSALHLIGILCDDQSPHGDPDHLLALLSMMKHQEIKRVFLHLFTDGRDSGQYMAIDLLRRLSRILEKNQKIATISGRFYGMDRGKNWERTEKVYNALVLGEGLLFDNPEEVILHAYNRGETDEFIQPSVIIERGKPVGTVSDNDSIIFFNLRSDRARQIAKTFVQKDFNEMNPGSFTRKKVIKNVIFVAMTDFGPDLGNILTAYPSKDIKDTLPMALKNLKQLYLAETEKYAHVTYFLNGGYADPVGGEERIMISSPVIKCYAEKPEMSASGILEAILVSLNHNKYDFIAVNFANPDMLGHTGNLKAAILGIEFLDQCVKQIVDLVLKKQGTVFITADHGNAEEMLNLKTGEIDTEHSINPVPFIVVNHKFRKLDFKKEGILADIAPTILSFLNIKAPVEMINQSLCHFISNH